MQKLLCARGLSVPQIYAADRARGALLIEDFGDRVYGREIADGADLLTQKLTMKAVYDGTNELVTCRYRSTDAAS